MVIRKITSSFLFLCILSLTVFFGASSAQASIVLDEPNLVADIAEQVSPSVVYIDTVRYATTRFQSPFRPFFDDPFFRRFFDFPEDQPPQRIPQRGVGSGFIFGEDGYIVTNHHVVQNAEEINVTLLDGREYIGRVIGADPLTDLAVVKIESDEALPTVILGDSDVARVGEWVIAIGNPYGLSNTVTVGVLSAKGRPITAGDTGREYENFLQTDAAINPGNSGGPLLNLQGEVIGINTAIIPFAQGLGFAIPINLATELLDDLIEHGRVVRAWLGVYIQDVTQEIARQFGLEEAQGALVAEVNPGSPAERSGIQRGDIILRVEEVLIEDVRSLQRTIRAFKPGEQVTVEVWRDDTSVEIEAILEELDQEIDFPVEIDPMVDIGFEVSEITPELQEKYELDLNRGIVIVSVWPGGPADQVGLQPGDVILELNRREIQTLDEWRELVMNLVPGDTALLLINRYGRTYYVPVTVEEKS